MILTILLVPVVVIIIFCVIYFIVFTNKNKKSKQIAEEKNKIYENEKIEKQNIKKLEIENIENEIKSNPIFNDSKLIYGYDKRNGIIFAKTGEIGIFIDNIEGMKIMNIKDIISMKHQYINDTTSCILTINDFNNPTINIVLNYYDKIEGKGKYDEIKQYYTLLKKQIK